VSSPLGKYGQLVAAVIAVGIIGAYLVANLGQAALGLDERAVANLKDIALIAVGAVFGATATINGVKAPIESAHSRIDRLQEQTGLPTHGSYPMPPHDQPPSGPSVTT
jgi:hypothetical protein